MSILRRITDFVLQGRIQACATAFMLAYIPVIGSAGILIPGLITLRKGAIEGLIVFLAATIPYLLSYYSAPSSSSMLEIDIALIAVVIVVCSNIFMWLFALVLRRFSSWGFIFDLAILLGVVTIGIIHLMYPDVKNWWGVQLTGFFNKSSAMMAELQPGAEIVPAAAQESVVNAIKLYATGIFFVSVIFNALLQLVISRWWQAVMFNPGELRKELLRIRLSYIAGVLFFISYGLTSVGNETTTDMMPVMYLIFSMTGLSVLHCLLAKMARLQWIVLLYVGIIGIMTVAPGGIWWVALALSLVAFLDIGLNFRKL